METSTNYYNYEVITSSGVTIDNAFLTTFEHLVGNNSIQWMEGRPVLSRDESRKKNKKIRRKYIIEIKLRTLFRKCSVHILDSLTDSERTALQRLASELFTGPYPNYDYFPMPKTLHRKMRKHIHDNPNCRSQRSLANVNIWFTSC